MSSFPSREAVFSSLHAKMKAMLTETKMVAMILITFISYLLFKRND
jgi:hypothetical protein